MADATVDIRVTAGLHPDNVKNIQGVGWDSEAAMVLQPTFSAFEEAYRGIAAVHDARAAAKSNPTMNEAAQLIATQDYADKVFARVAKALDVTHDNLRKGITHLEAELTRPVEAKASHPLASEIRAHVKALKPEDRMSMLRHAIESGDDMTASSILGAPAFLSGLNSEIQMVLLRTYHEKTFPQQAKRLKAMQGALNLIRDRGGLLLREFEKAVGKSPHEIQRLREAKLNAERALQSA